MALDDKQAGGNEQKTSAPRLESDPNTRENIAYILSELDGLRNETAGSLGGLSDVTITGPSTNDLLQYNGSAWVDRSLSEAGISAVGHEHAAADITSGTFLDARIAESNVTQHQAALSITESQISDLAHYTTSDFTTDFANEVLGNLSNIVLTGEVSGEILKFDGSNWINNTIGEAGIAPINNPTFTGYVEVPSGTIGTDPDPDVPGLRFSADPDVGWIYDPSVGNERVWWVFGGSAQFYWDSITIAGLPDPTISDQVATKNYVDSEITSSTVDELNDLTDVNTDVPPLNEDLLWYDDSVSDWVNVPIGSGGAGIAKLTDIPTVNDSTITVNAGNALVIGTGDGVFSTNQATGESFTIDHDAIGTAGTYGSAVTHTVPNVITTDTYGHISATITEIDLDTWYLQLDGSSAMTGTLDMGSNNITNVADPTTDDHVMDRGYADARYAPLSNPTFTGYVEVPSGTVGTNPDPHVPGLRFSADTDVGWVYDPDVGNERVLAVFGGATTFYWDSITIAGLPDPTLSDQVATKNYVDTEVTGSTVDELNDLSDVSITSPINEDLLWYDTSVGGGTWVNVPIGAGGAGIAKLTDVPTVNDSTITVNAGNALVIGTGDGVFSTNQASGESFTIDHDTIGTSGTYGSAVTHTVPNVITTDAYGHISATITEIDLDTWYYTETELDGGQLDNRYYTETELNGGQLDTRYGYIDGTPTISGAWTFSNTGVSIQALTLGTNSIASQFDLKILSNGVFAVESSLYMMIDATNLSTVQAFYWGHNSDDTTGFSELMKLEESGNLTLTGNVSGGTWTGNTIDSAYLDTDIAYQSETATIAAAWTFTTGPEIKNDSLGVVMDSGWTTGGRARGISLEYPTGTRVGGFGMYGVDGTLTRIYVGATTTPWSNYAISIPIDGQNVSFGDDAILLSGNYLRLDGNGSGDTYIREDTGDRMQFAAGGHSMYLDGNSNWFGMGAGDDGTIDLGRSTAQWKNLYVQEVWTDGISADAYIKFTPEGASAPRMTLYTDDDTATGDGVLRVYNGSNWGFLARGVGNDPRIGAYSSGSLHIAAFTDSTGATYEATSAAEFDFANDDILFNYDLIFAANKGIELKGTSINMAITFNVTDGSNTNLLEFQNNGTTFGYLAAYPSSDAVGITDADFFIKSGNKIYLDNHGNTYIEENSADVMRFVAGGIATAEITGSALRSPGGGTTLGDSSHYWDITYTDDIYIKGSIMDADYSNAKHRSIDVSDSAPTTETRRTGSLWAEY